MASDTWKECLAVLGNFLEIKIFDGLADKHQLFSNSSALPKDLLEALCSTFPANLGANFEDFNREDVSLVSTIALHTSLLFSCGTLLNVFKNYFRELLGADKTVQALKLCKVVFELVKACPLTWLLELGKNEEMKTLEISHLEKPKENIVSLLLFLLKTIDLTSLNSKQLTSDQKMKIFPEIVLLCHGILRKFREDSTIPDSILRNLEMYVMRRIACDSVTTCIQQTGKQHWVSDVSKKISLEFLDFVSGQCGCSGVEDLLSGSDAETAKESQERKIFPNGLLGNILKSLKHFMSKDKLVDSPVAIHVLVWSVGKVKHPSLGRHISMVLPPLLLLIDDYRVHNVVTGIRALGHVIDNVNASELCWYGRADVIYEALHHRMYTNEPEVIRELHLCLLKILKVIEPSPKKPIAGRQMNKCDINFQIILSGMEFESKIALRRAYCQHLVEFVNHMGITVLRHLKCLMTVVFRYLEIPDGTTEEWRIVMLDVMKSIITNAWPRMSVYADDILECLMKLVIDMSTSCDGVRLDVQQAILMKIDESLLLMLFCCGEPVRRQLEEMTSGLGHTETENLITRTLNAYKSQIESVNSHIK